MSNYTIVPTLQSHERFDPILFDFFKISVASIQKAPYFIVILVDGMT